MSSQKISLNPIGFVNSPYKQKFGIPRQANLVSAGVGSIELNEEHTDINCLRGIEQFSHLWVVFLFHATANRGWSATVKPPRLGGKENVGVFSSRAPPAQLTPLPTNKTNPASTNKTDPAPHQQVFVRPKEAGKYG